VRDRAPSGPDGALLTLGAPGAPGVEQERGRHTAQRFEGYPDKPTQAWWRSTAPSVATRVSRPRLHRAPSFGRGVQELYANAAEKCTQRVALVLGSTQGLDLVDEFSELMRRSHGRLTLMYIVDGRGPWVSSSLAPISAAEMTSYAVSWGEALLKRATSRVPLDVPVSTQLLIDDYEKGRPEPLSVLLGGGYDLVVFEQRQRCSRRLKHLIRDLAGAGIAAHLIDTRERQRPAVQLPTQAPLRGSAPEAPISQVM
jgi:hypothetical protein